MQARIECMGTLPGFRWRMLNTHLYDPWVTPWFLLLYASVDFHYMPGSLFPSIVPEVVFFSCSLFLPCNRCRRGSSCSSSGDRCLCCLRYTEPPQPGYFDVTRTR